MRSLRWCKLSSHSDDDDDDDDDDDEEEEEEEDAFILGKRMDLRRGKVPGSLVDFATISA
jgi:hypothetical protein